MGENAVPDWSSSGAPESESIAREDRSEQPTVAETAINWVRERPLAAMCAALAGGFIASTLFAGRKRPGEHSEATRSEKPRAGRASATPPRAPVRRVPLLIELPSDASGRKRRSGVTGFALGKLGGHLRASLQGALASGIAAMIHNAAPAQPNVRPACAATVGPRHAQETPKSQDG